MNRKLYWKGEHKMSLTIATDEAVQMLAAGWTVRYLVITDEIEWRTPDGMSADHYRSESLDRPPRAAVEFARTRGEIVDRPRIAK